MVDYIQSVRNIVDSLAASGHEISDANFFHYVLRGFDRRMRVLLVLSS